MAKRKTTEAISISCKVSTFSILKRNLRKINKNINILKNHILDSKKSILEILVLKIPITLQNILKLKSEKLVFKLNSFV